MIILHKIILNFSFSYQSFPLAALMKAAAMLWDGLWRGPQGLWPTASNVKTLGLTTHKDLNPANNHVSLKADLFPIEPPDENSPLAHTLIVALQRIQLIHAQTSDSPKLRDKKCVCCYK